MGNAFAHRRNPDAVKGTCTASSTPLSCVEGMLMWRQARTAGPSSGCTAAGRPVTALEPSSQIFRDDLAVMQSTVGLGAMDARRQGIVGRAAGHIPNF